LPSFGTKKAAVMAAIKTLFNSFVAVATAGFTMSGFAVSGSTQRHA
jgi:hypothetical protein